MARLRRADCSGPGIRRRRAGRGFTYLDEEGNRVSDPEVLERIKALVIPPAWTDVWICPHPMGHIQATGTDARGRTQYRYHDAWRTRRDQQKFDHMLDFARSLPEIRRRCAEYLAHEELTRARVLACAIRLLDLGFFRIGGESYAEENQTYGLATIEKRHVRIQGDLITFDYPAKGGQRRVQSVVDADILAVVSELKARRGGGRQLLAWREGRRWVDVSSQDINVFLKEISGGVFSAKDFRTWTATVLTAVALAVSTPASSRTARQRAIARAVKEVAGYLGNTPQVCRSSYIDPRVIDCYKAGATIYDQLERLGEEPAFGQLCIHGAVEEAALDLLEHGPPARSRPRARVRSTKKPVAQRARSR